MQFSGSPRRRTEKGIDVATHYIAGIGVAVFCIGAFCLLAQAFAKSTGWGVAMLLAGGLLWPVFVFKYWKDTSFWFFVALTGALVAYVFRT